MKFKIPENFREIIELLALFIFCILFVRGCSSCFSGYHADYGMKGWFESVIKGEKFMQEKYNIKEETHDSKTLQE
jgi:hypothetical protein